MLLHAEPDAWIWFCLTVLAVWRTTRMLCYERGPFRLFVQLRRLFVALRMASVVTCFHCAAVWIAAAAVVVIYEPLPVSLLLALGAAGGASALEIALPLESEDGDMS
jgi:hypothetical protein